MPAALTASAQGASKLTLTATPEVPGLTFVATDVHRMLFDLVHLASTTTAATTIEGRSNGA